MVIAGPSRINAVSFVGPSSTAPVAVPTLGSHNPYGAAKDFERR